MLGWAQVTHEEKEGRPCWVLRGHTAVDGHLVMVTISFAELEDANWAVATWRSVRHECQEEAAGERPS